jgi:glucokinase
MKYRLGIDLGGSSVKAVAVTAVGETLRQANVNFDPAAGQEWATCILEVVKRFHRELGGKPACIGLSAPGLAAKDGRSIAYLPNRLPGLEGFNWTKFLKISNPVPVINDAQAALLGEVWLGAARGFQNVILLTLGTGVGGAAMVDGRLLRGHTGKAGHLGHICLDVDGAPDICGTPGSLEMLIGNCTIVERTGGRFQSTHELLTAHRAGDKRATIIWLRSVKALASAIGSFTNLLDPEAVIIGGGIARAKQALFKPLRGMVSQVEWKVCGHEVKILPAQLGEFAGAYGAASREMQSNRS